MGIPLLHLLPDFGAPAAPPRGFAETGPDAAAGTTEAGTAGTPAGTHAAGAVPEMHEAMAGPIADPVTEAVAEALAAAAARHGDELAAQEARFAGRLDEERRRWTDEQAGALARALGAATAELEARIATAAAAAMAPLLSDAVRDRMLAALADSVRGLVSGAAGAPLEASGPGDLLDALRARLGDDGAAALAWRQTDGAAELRVVCGDTVIETELARWAALFQEASQ